MKITLKNTHSLININTMGAYIGNFEINNKPIFFPRVMVKIGQELKVRGGMHICAPNFGANNTDLELDQHGFARDLEWEVIDQKESSILLKLDGIKDYENVEFRLNYELKDTSLFARLEIINNSNERKLISPGFHPYFYQDHRPILINNVEFEKDKLIDSIYEPGKNQEFIANGNHIEIRGLQNINEYVFWTDFKGDYICIEPTYKGNSFEVDYKDSYELKENESFVQEIEIKVFD